MASVKLIFIPGSFCFLCASPAIVKKSSKASRVTYLISSDLHWHFFTLAADFGQVNLGVVH